MLGQMCSGHQVTAKKFKQMQKWGERERQWDKLENNFNHKAQHAQQEQQYRQPVRHREPRQRPRAEPQGWGAGNNSEKEKVSQIVQCIIIY